MMTGPKRLLEVDPVDDAGMLERELLSSLRPTSETRSAIWQRVSAQVGLAAAATTAATATTTVAAAAKSTSVATGGAAVGKAGALGALSSKLGVALLVAAPLVGTGAYLGFAALPSAAPAAPSRDETVRPRVESAELDEAGPQGAAVDGTGPDGTALEAATTAASAPGARRREVDTPSGAATKRASEPKAPSAAQSELVEENRLLRKARAESRAGQTTQALATLQDLDARFAQGALLQEREVLRIQTLQARGESGRAAARAERFLRLYPESPYALHVRQVAAAAPR